MITSGFIKSIQDIMRKDRGIGTGDVVRQLDQLIWMIFLKAFDDIEAQKQFIDSSYQSVVPMQYRWRTWAAAEDGITGDKLLDFINNDLMPGLRDLPAINNNAIIRIAFEESHNYMKDGTLLRQVVNKINSVNFNSSDDRHTFNDLYETLLSSLQSAGDAGEYYTPRAVTKFITEMVAPKLGESVLDPACGTGGFLSSAIDILHAQAKTPEDMALIEQSINGVEKMQLPYSLCIVNMMLHGIDNPINVRYDNTLSRPLISYGPADYVDTIVANPPFGGQEVDGIEKNFPSSYRTRETADLFLVLMIRLLKDHGRAGIVLPDGTLFGEGVKTRIKEHLLNECNLHTIVRLPKSVFAPYASIATNLLFFTKGEPTKEIWYYEHRLPEGVKAYNKTKPIRHEEFKPIKDWWSDRQETEVAWKISIEEIKNRSYNLDIKNPNIIEINEIDPKDILQQYRDKWKVINDIADELQASLKHIFNYHMGNELTFLANNLHEYLHVSGAIRLLRKTILHLAISGQLVPQDPSEGTGQELYDQIQKEKVKLIAEGKLKKQKPLPAIANDEIPFEIPQNWKWMRLGEICWLDQGRKSTGETYNYLEAKFLRGKKDPEIKDTGFIIETGMRAILVDGENSGEVFIMPETGYMGSTFKVLNKVDNFNDDYLGFILLNLKEEMRNNKIGAAIPHLDKKLFKEKLTPLPPLIEQKRIVTKTTELLNLINQLEPHLEGK